MKRQRILLIASVGMIVALSVSELHAGSVVISSHHGPKIVASRHAGIGFGVWIGHPPVVPARPHRPVIVTHPPHRRVIVTHPPHRPVVVPHRPHRRFVHVRPPHHKTVVVRHPVVRPVVVHPAPPVVVHQPAPVTETVVTIWITNSNGSRTSVRLTREGSWYVGPRGEYYNTLPTNEQLRVIYGF